MGTANTSIAGKLISITVILLTVLSAGAIMAVLFFYPLPDQLSAIDTQTRRHSHANELSYVVYDEMIKTFEVTVVDGTQSQTVVTEESDVGSLLTKLQIDVDESDTLSHMSADSLYPGMVIQIDRYHTDEVTESKPIPYDTIYKETAMIPKGSSHVLQKGIEGAIESKYKITYQNGEEFSRRLCETTLTKEPVDAIVLQGTADGLDAVDPQTSTISVGGKTYTYEKAVSVTATAYTCEGSDFNTTFTGTTARVGAIAVDPRVIPLNSKLFIAAKDGTWVYGFATAEDTGSFIKGKRIDLYFDTKYECIEFGRQETTVYILEN